LLARFRKMVTYVLRMTLFRSLNVKLLNERNLLWELVRLKEKIQ
jgi:hypothetical protein